MVIYKYIFSYLFDWFNKYEIKTEDALSLEVDIVVVERANQTQ